MTASRLTIGGKTFEDAGLDPSDFDVIEHTTKILQETTGNFTGALGLMIDTAMRRSIDQPKTEALLKGFIEGFREAIQEELNPDTVIAEARRIQDLQGIPV